MQKKNNTVAVCHRNRHRLRLSRVFTVRMKKAWIHSNMQLWAHIETQADLNHRWAHSNLVVLSYHGPFYLAKQFV